MKQVKNLKWLGSLLCVILGNCLYAIGVVLFIEPSGLITGGTTGIGLFIHHLTGQSASLFILGINTVMFLLGLWLLGRKFALTTLVSSFCYPLALNAAERLTGGFVLTDDLLLCALFGGIFIGGAIGIVIRAGSSTGGMDIPPLVLNKFRGIPVSIGMWGFDCAILILQAAFSPRNAVLYGVLLVMVYTFTLDKLLLFGKGKTQIKIISRRSEDIRKAILEEIDRGVTMLHGSTGFLGDETQVVLSVISPHELPRAEKLIRTIDPDAFVMVNKVTEVRGHGFSSGKVSL